MAGWRDFIDAIDEERKKAGRWIGDRAEDVGDAASAVGSFAGDVLQSIPRGVGNIYLSLDEASRNMDIDNRNKTIDELLKIDPKERSRYANMSDEEMDKLDEKEWSKAFTIRRAKKQLGSVDDDALKKRKDENAAERKTHRTYKADNDFMKFLIGGEEDEVAQSAQKTNEDITTWGKGQGMNDTQAGALGFVGALGLTALDAPTGVGSLVKTPLKSIGKSGIKQLVKETTEEGAEAIVKKAIPNASDDALKTILPRLVNATDEKAVREVLRGADNLIPGVRGSLGSTRDDLVQGTRNLIKKPGTATDDVAETLADDLTESAAKNAPTPPTRPNSAGPATDKLLSRVKTTSEVQDAAPNNGFKDRFKAEWVDKLSPVNDFVKTIEQQTGKKLTTEDNPYELMRLYNGMPDQVQKRVQVLTDTIKQAPDLDAVRVIGLGRQIESRAGRGAGSFVSLDDAKAAIQEQYAKLGPKKFDEASRVVDTITQYNKDLLDDLHKGGIISDEALDAINNMGGDYFARFNVINHIMKNDQNRALFSRSGSYNTTEQSRKKIVASLKGMEEGTEILDPFESLVRSTDHAMRAIAKNDIWHAFNRLADEVPDLIVRTRDPENVAKRIALSLDNKELRPIRNKLDRMISTRGQWVRRLESEVNKLNKKGLNISLKQGGERMTNQAFDVAGLGGEVATSQTGRQVAQTSPQQLVSEFVDVVKQGTTKAGGTLPPQKLGPADTQAFLRNLIEKGSRSDIDKIKKMIGNRDVKMTNLLDEIGEMKSQYDDIAGTIKTNVDEAKELADLKAPEGMELISGFGKGIQGKLAVPKEVADVFTGKTKAQEDYLTGIFGGVNKFVKQALTANNPVFALITNPIRDAKTFAYNSRTTKATPFHVGYALAKGVTDAIGGRMGKSDIYDRWVKSGGRSGFYADERAAEEMARDLAREVGGKKVLGVKVAPVHNAKDFIREASRVISTPIRVPLKGLRGAAGILEDAPRLAEFRGGLNKNMTDKQAAFLSRNVTVDFQQAGQHAQVVNAWVPFLNARFQGTLKSVDAIKSNPARAATTYATLTATPIMLAAYNNYVRFPEVTKMISEEERANNFVIVLGDEQDESGNYTQVLKIPKADVDKVLGNPLEQIARFMADDDPQTLAEVLTNMVGSITPVDIVRDNEFSAERAVSGVLPAPLKIPLEAAANRSFYFGSDLVSRGKQDLPVEEQVNDSTTGAAKFLGAISGQSPIKVDNTLGNLGLRTAAKLVDNPTEPFASKLTGSTGNRMNDEFYDILDEVSPQRKRADTFINEALARGDYAAAQETAQNYNAYLLKKFSPLNERYSNEITQDMVDAYNEKKIVLTGRSISQRRRNQLEREAAQ